MRFSARSGGSAAASTADGTHGYLPTFDPDILTAFVARGAGVRGGAVAPVLHMGDVAPFVAGLPGIPFDAPDVVLRPGLLAPPSARPAVQGTGGSR
ncbi:MAG: hypothetical protein AB1941_00765 [Gemmatimonadota bacterium]